MGPRSSQKSVAAIALTVAIGFALVATIVVWALHPSTLPSAPKVIVGTQDEVYYYHAATKADARLLGQALIRIGFLSDRGTAVLLSKGAAGTEVSFVVSNDGWDHPATVNSYEEIGRRVAPAIGGFPIQVRLIDATRTLRKEFTVGRVPAGAKDEVYYFGSATDAEAAALGHALRIAKYFTDLGASVELSKGLSKGDITSISFVLDEGAWERPDAAVGFERLVRQIAPAVGGLPVQLRLLNPRMEPKKEWVVR